MHDKNLVTRNCTQYTPSDSEKYPECSSFLFAFDLLGIYRLKELMTYAKYQQFNLGNKQIKEIRQILFHEKKENSRTEGKNLSYNCVRVEVKSLLKMWRTKNSIPLPKPPRPFQHSLSGTNFLIHDELLASCFAFK